MGKYFTEKERYQLEAYYNKLHMKPKEISKLMGKHINTIYNELKRGRVKLVNTELKEYYLYCADYAQEKYKYNATAKGRQLKIANDYAFAEFIETKIKKEKYSFYAVLETAKGHFKTDVCLRTLYNYYYRCVLNIKPVDMPYNKRKRNDYKLPKRIYRFGRRLIDERPNEVVERDSFGHWELDSVVSGKGCKQALLVLTERKTRYELIFRIKNKTCAEVWRRFESISKKLGESFGKVFKTVTCDNGVEFSTNYEFKDERVKKFVQTNLYYCHPYCSSERGSNEKQNTLIRRFIPKGVHISAYTDKYIKQVQDWINAYPRKIFNGLSSNDMLSNCMNE